MAVYLVLDPVRSVSLCDKLCGVCGSCKLGAGCYCKRKQPPAKESNVYIAVKGHLNLACAGGL